MLNKKYLKNLFIFSIIVFCLNFGDNTFAAQTYQSLNYSKNNIYRPILNNNTRWKNFPVTIYIENVPAKYKPTVINAINYWKTYFPFEISNNPDSDVNILWGSSFPEKPTAAASTTHVFDNNIHKSLIEVRNKEFPQNGLSEIMLHELGHVAGLGESPYPEDIMYHTTTARDGRVTRWTFICIGYVPLILPTGYQSKIEAKSLLSQRDADHLAQIYADLPENDTNKTPQDFIPPPIPTADTNNRNDTNTYSTYSSKEDIMSNYVAEGSSFFRQKNYQKALESFEKAEAINPGNPVVNSNIGVCHLYLGNYDSAINYTNKAIAVNPNKADNYVTLGLSYKEKNLYDKAIENYQKAISLDSGYTNAYINVSSVYVDTGKNDLAIQCCQKAIELDPNIEVSYINMGVAYQNKGDYNKALELFKKAMSINPNSTLAKNNYHNLNNYLRYKK